MKQIIFVLRHGVGISAAADRDNMIAQHGLQGRACVTHVYYVLCAHVVERV
jgi:hypothetical protein